MVSIINILKCRSKITDFIDFGKYAAVTQLIVQKINLIRILMLKNKK
jgi:hypothetical protein